MKTRVLDFSANLKAIGDGKGEFEGYGSVFGVVDSYRDVVQKGAFAESLNTRGMPALLWQHKSSEPCGIYIECREDEYGLFVKGQLNLETQTGREAYALLKQGALRGLSIGFDVAEEEMDSKTGINYLKKLNLWEVSLVTFPANREANVEAVKTAPGTVRQFEEFLRDAGYSQKEATLIAAKGFKAREAHRECGDLGVVLMALEGVVNQLKKVTLNERYGETGEA